MPSVHFKQRQKQHLLTALRELPKPIPGIEAIHLAAVLRRCLGQGMPMPVAEAAPEGSIFIPEDDTLAVRMEVGDLRRLRYQVALPSMPMPIKIHMA